MNSFKGRINSRRPTAILTYITMTFKARRLPQQDEVVYLIGKSNYTYIHIASGKVMLFSYTLKRVLGEGYPSFARVHKSCAINPEKITGVRHGNPVHIIVQVAGETKLLPVSRRHLVALGHLVQLQPTVKPRRIRSTVANTKKKSGRIAQLKDDIVVAEFNTISEAARKTAFGEINIREALESKLPRRGFTWHYI